MAKYGIFQTVDDSSLGNYFDYRVNMRIVNQYPRSLFPPVLIVPVDSFLHCMALFTYVVLGAEHYGILISDAHVNMKKAAVWQCSLFNTRRLHSAHPDKTTVLFCKISDLLCGIDTPQNEEMHTPPQIYYCWREMK